jgi:hypothetical protein
VSLEDPMAIKERGSKEIFTELDREENAHNKSRQYNAN